MFPLRFVSVLAIALIQCGTNDVYGYYVIPYGFDSPYGSYSDAIPSTGTTTPPPSTAITTEAPPVTMPPITVPPVTVPPVTVPPVTVPSVTVPPVTVPPVTASPVTIPPVTAPPVTEPPMTMPPTTSPPIIIPPVTPPPVTQPPVTMPPITPPPTPSVPGCVCKTYCGGTGPIDILNRPQEGFIIKHYHQYNYYYPNGANIPIPLHNPEPIKTDGYPAVSLPTYESKPIPITTQTDDANTATVNSESIYLSDPNTNNNGGVKVNTVKFIETKSNIPGDELPITSGVSILKPNFINKVQTYHSSTNVYRQPIVNAEDQPLPIVEPELAISPDNVQKDMLTYLTNSNTFDQTGQVLLQPTGFYNPYANYLYPGNRQVFPYPQDPPVFSYVV